MTATYVPPESDAGALAAVTAEAAARAAADSAEVTARTSAINTAITGEATARTDADTALDGRLATVESRRLDQVPAPTAAVALNAQKITGLADPTNPQDAATRAFTLAQITALINGAPGALDTLKEIADQLASDETAAGALTTSVSANAAAIAGIISGATQLVAVKLGDAGESAFTDPARAHIPLLQDTYHGQAERGAGILVPGRQQGSQGFARYFAATQDDSAQAFSYATILPGQADGKAIIQSLFPVAGGEFDNLVQAWNEARGYSGRSVASIGSAEVQGSGYAEFNGHFYASAKSARDAAGTARTLSGAQAIPAAPTTFVLQLDATPSDWATQGKVTLVDGANTCTVYYSGISGPTLTGCTLRVGDTPLTYASGSTATRSPSHVRQHFGLLVERPAAPNANGRIDNQLGVYARPGIHTEDAFTIGAYTGVYAYANAALSIGNTVITLATANGLPGTPTPNFSNGQTVQIGVGREAEFKVISGVGAGTVTVAALAKAHPAGALIQVVDANAVGNMYMSAGVIATDVNFQPPGVLPGQITVRFTNGAGYQQMPAQTGGTPGTPSAGNARLYVNGNKVWVIKGEDALESPVRTGHRKTTASDLVLTALDGGIVGVTSTAASRLITLPALSTVPDGWEVLVKDESGAAGTNNITVSRVGSDDIEGVATKVINANYGSIRLYRGSATRWFVA